jgi:hypothetical protein
MRAVKYLSPTSLMCFYKDRDDFFLRYLADQRPPRIPQNQPMAIGSAFDAYVKSYLHEKLYGKGVDPRFDLATLFEAQVEAPQRKWAWEHGRIVFEEYKKSGTLADLILELDGAIGEPRFEAEVFGAVNGVREGVTTDIGPIPLLGKPDVYFINKEGYHVILDWKVNGYCSEWGASPMQGYVRLREVNQETKSYNGAQFMYMGGVLVNISSYLETLNKDWATQLAIYFWLCGGEVGQKFIAAIDQIVCRKGKMRFAEHRMRTSDDFQWGVFAKAQHAWKCIQSGHVFDNLSREESDQRADTLARQYEVFLKGTGDKDFDDMFRQLARC